MQPFDLMRFHLLQFWSALRPNAVAFSLLPPRTWIIQFGTAGWWPAKDVAMKSWRQGFFGHFAAYSEFTEIFSFWFFIKSTVLETPENKHFQWARRARTDQIPANLELSSFINLHSFPDTTFFDHFDVVCLCFVDSNYKCCDVRCLTIGIALPHRSSITASSAVESSGTEPYGAIGYPSFPNLRTRATRTTMNFSDEVDEVIVPKERAVKWDYHLQAGGTCDVQKIARKSEGAEQNFCVFSNLFY